MALKYMSVETVTLNTLPGSSFLFIVGAQPLNALMLKQRHLGISLVLTLVAVPLVDVPLIYIALVVVITLAIIGRASDRRTSTSRLPSRRRCHRSIALSTALSTRLHLVRVDAGSTTWRIMALPGLLSTVIIHVFEIKRMYMTREISKYRQAYVDE